MTETTETNPLDSPTYKTYIYNSTIEYLTARANQIANDVQYAYEAVLAVPIDTDKSVAARDTIARMLGRIEVAAAGVQTVADMLKAGGPNV